MQTRGPIVQVVPIDLSAAGKKTINDAVTHITFVKALDQSGAQALGAALNIALGDVAADSFPCSVNTIIQTRNPVSPIVVTWAAQPGITAYLALSQDGVAIHAPPTTQLVTQAVGSTISAAQATVGTAAAQIVSGGSRQSVMIQNNGTADLYVGDSTVTTGTGFKVPANGGVLTVDKTTAAIYGVVASGTTDVRMLTEI